MKRALIICSVCFCLLAYPAGADDGKKYDFGIKVGYQLFTESPMSDVSSAHPAFGAFYNYWLGQHWGLGIDVCFHTVDSDSGRFLGTNYSSEVTMIPFIPQLIYRRPIGASENFKFSWCFGPAWISHEMDFTANVSGTEFTSSNEGSALGFSTAVCIGFRNLRFEAQYLFATTDLVFPEIGMERYFDATAGQYGSYVIDTVVTSKDRNVQLGGFSFWTGISF
jgi:hypothetical protein